MPAITRTDAEALIREQIEPGIVQNPAENSAFLNLARRLTDMTSGTTKVPVLSMLPMAYWVNGDSGYKQSSKAAWDNVFLHAAELAVIVPIPEAVLEDADFDIVGEVEPRVREAIGARVDLATMFGIGRPSEWQNDIVTLARQAGNNVSPGGTPDYYDLLLGENGVISKVEDDGYMHTGAVASMAMRGKLRGIRTTDGIPLFKSDMQGATRYALDGAPMYFPRNGGFDSSVAQLIVGDFSQAVYSIRKDITVKILDQAVIQDPATGDIVYNLAQQDMIAIRVTFRMGWALPNPVNPLNPDRTGVPFAYLEPATAATTYAVTVTVKDTQSTPAPIEGASVNINGSILKTNSSGQAVFNLRPGTYPMTVKASGFTKATDSVTVVSSAVSKAITLA